MRQILFLAFPKRKKRKKIKKSFFQENSKSTTAAEYQCELKCWSSHYAFAAPNWSLHQCFATPSLIELIQWNSDCTSICSQLRSWVLNRNRKLLHKQSCWMGNNIPLLLYLKNVSHLGPINRAAHLKKKILISNTNIIFSKMKSNCNVNVIYIDNTYKFITSVRFNLVSLWVNNHICSILSKFFYDHIDS